MTRNRYRYSTAANSRQYFDDASAATLDGAIDEAKRIALNTKASTYRVYVTDTETIPHVCRGFATGRTWTWMKACRTCGGSGVFARKMGAQSYNEQCSKCAGAGAIADV